MKNKYDYKFNGFTIEVFSEEIQILDELKLIENKIDNRHIQSERYKLGETKRKITNNLSLETLNIMLKELCDCDIHFYRVLSYNCVVKLKPREYIARYWDLDNPFMNGFGGNLVTIEDTCEYDNGSSYGYAARLKELYGRLPFHFIDEIVKKSTNLDYDEHDYNVKKPFGLLSVINIGNHRY